MERKEKWIEPQVTDLSVKMTEYGDKITDHIDDSIKVGKYTYYSFS